MSNLDTMVEAPETPDTSAQGAFEKFATRTRAATIRPESPRNEPAPLTVTDEASYADVKPGTKYVDPSGETRTKAWEVKSSTDYDKVPEGSTYLDPQGEQRTKPTFEPITYSAQTLYDMSVTPSEKKKALERSYPGMVKEDGQGLYVEDGEKFRRPGRGVQAAAGFATAAAAPVVGAVTGALGLGAVSGGLGSVAGGVGGSILGQTINDAVLQLAGVYDRGIVEQAAATGMAAAGGALGAGVGRGIAAVVPSAKAGISSVSQMLPSITAKFLGAGPELTAARELADKGVKVPPSAWAHEAPHLQNVVEVFHPAFDTSKPLLKSATEHYEKTAHKILDDFGVKREGSIVNPAADVPTQAAGERLLQKTLAESAEKDAALRAALDQRKTELASGAVPMQAQREAVTRAAEESRQAAQRLIDQSFASIQREADAGFTLAKAGAGTGDLWENVGNQLIAVRRGVGERASKMYAEADEIAGANLPDSSGLSTIAKEFSEQLPADFKAKYPDIVQKLGKLAEGEQPTFGQLHNLRSMLRGNADWYTLSSDIRNGTYKFFSKAVDDVLHGLNEPEVINKVAVRLVNETVEGANHFEAIKTLAKQRGEDVMKTLGLSNEGKLVDGFVTSKGRFVDRAEADRIAREVGQWQPATQQAEEGLGHGNLVYGKPDIERIRMLKNAADQLDKADKFYSENIKIFNAQQLKALMKGLEAGEPADPANLYRALVKEGQTDLTARVRDMVGPNLWAGVRAADVTDMLNAAKTLNPGEINGRAFAKEVLDRHQRGILDVVHGREVSERLLSQARAIEQLEGRLSIPVRPGDTMTQVVARARLAAEEAKALGTKDPLLTLQKDVKRLEAEMKREASQARRGDPLGFLYNKSTGASYAVDKILGDEDLILAAAARFGEKSGEFNALRQVYVERVLRGTLEPDERLAKIAPEVQQLMFPGVTQNQMNVLAKEMNLLMDTRANLRGDTAGGMSAMAKVENPVSRTPLARGAVKLLPGVNPLARATLGQYYQLVTKIMTSPTTLRWIEKGLTKGTPEEREAVREILRRHLQKGSAMGAGAGEAVYQGSGE